MIEQLRDIFSESLDAFFESQVENIQAGIAERNLCARLAMILEPKAHEAGFTDYVADAEYNRNRGRVKTILDQNAVVVRINCDLLLHSRGRCENDNLIAVEMKKSERPAKEEIEDCERLRILTKPNYDDVIVVRGDFEPQHVCGYKLGYFLWIDAATRTYRLKEFRNGEFVEELIRQY
ncbi:hypothetical protein BCT31_21840 [Vibrio lentus]|uniref:Uncharacterized protein n=1 Tax=Vibrio cortegadensis TaxID=1328770 RepID=A0ABV4MBL4_9VIBR|nr:MULTISPECIES: hypothetical protein [Vibrio]MBE4489927.1 hypothetical protein [Vibrio parahaemolyticus]MBE4494611.1 hypothetical protein [Vibrio parahaemolyticus]MBE4503508.1 hypothetical protein [Vibrio parahaemolyticus]MBE4508114.1 hypothetical protein [Vibrio parahaemolyticus]PMN49652.1 hypothetical protein BCT31_21840 [Vibrio lentus]